MQLFYFRQLKIIDKEVTSLQEKKKSLEQKVRKIAHKNHDLVINNILTNES
jgi:FtsZ-binding cell division protein ZapB